MGNGQGWHGEPEEHGAAGRKGGTTTSKRYGRAFYQRIGRMGGLLAHAKGTAHKLTNEERSKRKQVKTGKIESNVHQALTNQE